MARAPTNFAAGFRAVCAAMLSFLASGALAQTPPAAAPGGNSAIIVLDGSGSMGGPLEGQTEVKFNIASKAILEKLSTALPQSRVGLETFGNRRKGDCSDGDLVIPPAPGNLDQFTQTFTRIGPTGKGPLVYGVREAAEYMPKDAPGTIIVIHDDPDNCRQDICAAAADIAKQTPKITAHVISLSLDPTITEKMACLATATGGKTFQARDEASFNAALDEALQLAGVIKGGAAAAPTVDAAPLAPATDGPPSLRMTASLSSSAAQLAAPIQWRILQGGDAGQVVKEAATPILMTELAPGTYTVEAKYGYASAKQSVTVGENGRTDERISFNAANLKVSSLAGKTGDSAGSSVIAIAALDKQSNTAGAPVLISQAGQADVVLPAGAYRVSAADGLASKQQDITLEAGVTTPLDFSLSSGKLELSAVNKEGGDPLDGATFIVSIDDPDAPQGRREITRSAAPRPSFNVPAGTYYVTAKLGAAEVRDRIAIGTGDVVKHAVVLNGAWVKLSVALDTALFKGDNAIVYRVHTKGKDVRELATLHAVKNDPPVSVFLPQGSYRIDASAGRLNVKGGVDSEVVPGPAASVAIPIAASELTVAPPSADPTGWDLRDGQGLVVHRSPGSTSAKTLIVAPGRYTMRIEKSGAASGKQVELKPGERRTVTLDGS